MVANVIMYDAAVSAWGKGEQWRQALGLLALALGEVGQFQILLEGAADTSGTAVNLRFSELDGPGGSRLCGPGEACWEWWQVGYVFCNASSRVPGTSSGWYPDPLLPVEVGGVLLEPGQAQPLWAQ